jgi:hypothetical protein
MTSPIFRRQKSQAKWELGAFALPNRLVQDKNLTDSAFRLLAWMVSCSDDWIIYQTDIMRRFDWGREKLRSALDNLIEFRYLYKFPQSRQDDHRYGPCYYEFSPHGYTEEEIKEFQIKFPMYGYQTSGGQTSGSPTSNNLKTVCIAEANLSDNAEKKPEPREPQKVRSITKKNFRGDDISIGWDELITHATISKKDWRRTEMQDAWQILQDRQGYVNELMEFIAGTITNLRTKKRAVHANKEKPKCKNHPIVTKSENKICNPQDQEPRRTIPEIMAQLEKEKKEIKEKKQKS